MHNQMNLFYEVIVFVSEKNVRQMTVGRMSKTNVKQ